LQIFCLPQTGHRSHIFPVSPLANAITFWARWHLQCRAERFTGLIYAAMSLHSRLWARGVMLA